MSFEFDVDGLQDAVDQHIAEHWPAVRAEFNAQLQATVAQVNEEMAGQPADAVFAVLRDRIGPEIVDQVTDTVRAWAQGISDGTIDI